MKWLKNGKVRRNIYLILSSMRFAFLTFEVNINSTVIWRQFSTVSIFIFTLAECEVKDSRCSGMYQSCLFFDKIGHAKSVGFRFYSAIWRSESRISSRYLEITSISLIYSLTFSRKKELLFWLSRGLNRLTCVTRQIRGDSKLRDQPIALLLPRVVRNMKNSYEMMH